MDDQDLTGRDARQVFDDHLELRKRGDLEQDLARNYAPDVVVLTARGVLRGHDGVDSYLIERGRIVAQTIPYTVVSRELSVTDLAGGARSAADGRPTGESG